MSVRDGRRIPAGQVTFTPEQERAARAFALWHLGDPSWADGIMSALRFPERTMRELADERREDR